MEKKVLDYGLEVVEKGVDALEKAIIAFVKENGGCIRLDNPNDEYNNVFALIRTWDEDDNPTINEKKVLAVRVDNCNELEFCLAEDDDPDAVYEPDIDEDDYEWYNIDELFARAIIIDVAETISEDTFEVETIENEEDEAMRVVDEFNEELNGEEIYFDTFEKVDSKETEESGKVDMWMGVVKKEDKNEVYIYVINKLDDGEMVVYKQIYCDGAYPMTIDEARTYQFVDIGGTVYMLDENYVFIEVAGSTDNWMEGEIRKRLVGLKNKYATGVKINYLPAFDEWIEWEDTKGNKFISMFRDGETEDRETVMV